MAFGSGNGAIAVCNAVQSTKTTLVLRFHPRSNRLGQAVEVARNHRRARLSLLYKMAQLAQDRKPDDRMDVVRHSDEANVHGLLFLKLRIQDAWDAFRCPIIVEPPSMARERHKMGKPRVLKNLPPGHRPRFQRRLCLRHPDNKLAGPPRPLSRPWHTAFFSKMLLTSPLF